jgi:hypothetical protein
MGFAIHSKIPSKEDAMSKGKSLETSEIRAALSELNQLCKAEYEIELEEMLINTGPLAAMRMQRLTGIVLKQKFATCRQATEKGATGAHRAWPWKEGSLERSAANAQRELALLNELRMPGPWNERKPLSGTSDDKVPITWNEFKDDVEHERGLFKVVALYVADKMKGREGKTIREYFDAKESRRFEAGLDLAVLLSDLAVMGPIGSLLGVPTVAVGVTLVAMQYGYRRLTDPVEGRQADSVN